MNPPAVSVIIPTFNRLRLLREALDSVHAQTVRPHEVIVVDDGSQDDIGAGVADHPTKPIVIRQSRQGPGAARNRGVREATGDVIAFLDSDDIWLPTKLERYLAAMAARPDLDIFYGPMSPIDASGRPVMGRTKPCVEGRITEALFFSSFVHVPTIVCRRSILVASGGFDPTLPVCEDYELWLRLSVERPFGLIDEPLALRRLHDDRLSKERMDRNLLVKSRVLKDFYESGAGGNQLSPVVARRRLAKVFHAAARAVLREGRYQQALQLCRQSRIYGCPRIRIAPIMLAATAMSMLRTGKPELVLTTAGQ
ncbi:MAG TPA: glycosyltransferase [Phycisphaerae bacterium]|nr:glycosyltransferase [Phycisphaerae bacterium]